MRVKIYYRDRNGYIRSEIVWEKDYVTRMDELSAQGYTGIYAVAA